MKHFYYSGLGPRGWFVNRRAILPDELMNAVGVERNMFDFLANDQVAARLAREYNAGIRKDETLL